MGFARLTAVGGVGMTPNPVSADWKSPSQRPPRLCRRVGGTGSMKFYLIVAKGSRQGLPILVTVDLFLVGSDKMCQLRKRSLGLKHCAFVTRNKKVFVRDMDSG